jgi:hypothetical protein
VIEANASTYEALKKNEEPGCAGPVRLRRVVRQGMVVDGGEIRQRSEGPFLPGMQKPFTLFAEADLAPEDCGGRLPTRLFLCPTITVAYG